MRSVTLILSSCLFVGCCSAWRPDAAQSYTRGKEAARSGEYAKAREYFEEALKYRPDHEGAQAALLASLRETGLYDEAQKLADQFLSARESSGALHLERARSARARGDYAGAETHLQRALVL